VPFDDEQTAGIIIPCDHTSRDFSGILLGYFNCATFLTHIFVLVVA
jgi:hypothetical protein